MYNWSTDLKNLNKNPHKLAIFKLEQKINFGLNNQKLSTPLLKKYWPQLKIDPNKRDYLKNILW